MRTLSTARIPRLCRWFEKEESLTVEYGIRTLEPLIVRPSEPERPELVPLWAEAAQVLRSAEVVFVIGYSFPPYDQPVRTLFKNALERRQCPVYVLAPKPFEIAGELMEFLKQSEVIPWPCDWKALSEAVCKVMSFSSRVESKEVIRTYDKMLGLYISKATSAPLDGALLEDTETAKGPMSKLNGQVAKGGRRRVCASRSGECSARRFWSQKRRSKP